MTWLPATFHDPAAIAAYQEAADLAEWSSWLPFEDARPAAPREPGVYLLREPRARSGTPGWRVSAPAAVAHRACTGGSRCTGPAKVQCPDSVKPRSTGRWQTQTGWGSSLNDCARTGRSERRNGLVMPSCGSALRCRGRSAPTRTTHGFSSRVWSRCYDRTTFGTSRAPPRRRLRVACSDGRTCGCRAPAERRRVIKNARARADV